LRREHTEHDLGLRPAQIAGDNDGRLRGRCHPL
jgi:hypothetical protein